METISKMSTAKKGTPETKKEVEDGDFKQKEGGGSSGGTDGAGNSPIHAEITSLMGENYNLPTLNPHTTVSNYLIVGGSLFPLMLHYPPTEEEFNSRGSFYVAVSI